MNFPTWTRALVAELRTMLPETTATRRAGEATIRYGSHEAVLRNEGEHVAIWLGDRVAFTPVRNGGTARVIARSLAAHFDVERWGRG